MSTEHIMSDDPSETRQSAGKFTDLRNEGEWIKYEVRCYLSALPPDMRLYLSTATQSV